MAPIHVRVVQSVALESDQVDRVFQDRLAQYANHMWVNEDGNLMCERVTSHRWEDVASRKDVGEDYDIIFAACILKQRLRERQIRDRELREKAKK